MWTEYVIDATMGVRDGLLCFCPVERGIDDEIESVITGMNFLSDAPPRDGKLIAVVHAEGQPAVEAFCTENKALLDGLFARDSDGNPEGEAARAASSETTARPSPTTRTADTPEGGE